MPKTCSARPSRTPRAPKPNLLGRIRVLALRWAAKYYATERELALEMIKELDEADGVLHDDSEGWRRQTAHHAGILARDRESRSRPNEKPASRSRGRVPGGDVAEDQALRDRRARAGIRRRRTRWPRCCRSRTARRSPRRPRAAPAPAGRPVSPPQVPRSLSTIFTA